MHDTNSILQLKTVVSLSLGSKHLLHTVWARLLISQSRSDLAQAALSLVEYPLWHHKPLFFRTGSEKWSKKKKQRMGFLPTSHTSLRFLWFTFNIQGQSSHPPTKKKPMFHLVSKTSFVFYLSINTSHCRGHCCHCAVCLACAASGTQSVTF